MDSLVRQARFPALSDQLFRQRVRNNLIAYLELAASAERQRAYERSGSNDQVPSEVILQWEDWVQPANLDWFSPPVFSPEEISAIQKFQAVWRLVRDETPKPIPQSVEAVIGTDPWTRLAAAAHDALEIFAQRGRFNDDVEEPFAA